MGQRIHFMLKKSFRDFFEAVGNIIIFLPYFFSVSTLFKTLFLPWKNITSQTKSRGFSISDWASNLMFGLISRSIGFTMRCSVIIFYLFFQLILIVIFPVVFVIYIFLLPLTITIAMFSPTESEFKFKLKNKFIEDHLLENDNFQIVESWFESIYESRLKPTKWWSLKSLTSTPPLARDWAVGYTPQLDSYSEELTSPEYQSTIRDHIIGRENETGQIIESLTQSNQANAILVGESGVGKHTIINSFVKKIYEGNITPILAYKRVLKLNMEKIMSYSEDQNKREDFLKTLILESTISKNIILLIDNLDKYVSNSQGRVDMSHVIADFAKRSDIQFIAITTPYTYESFIFSNAQIQQLFTKIDVTEVSNTTAQTILFDQSIDFEKKYRVYIPYETISAVIDKSNFFMTTIPFPEKALQLMDAVCNYTANTLKKARVLPITVDEVLTKKTHVPTSISDQIKDKLLHLETSLKGQIIGQDKAIDEVASTLRRSFLLLGKRKKPLSTLLFLGPTGVGKTQTAKALSSVFFGGEDKVVRFDMSLYQTKADIEKLVGSVQNLNPGLLTNLIRENPYGVLLLDEIEKAHPDLLNIFLTVLDEGYFTDGFGQHVDCKNMVIIATSNAGSQFIFEFLASNPSANTQENSPISTNAIVDFLIQKRLFSPEFLNRFDGVVAYNPINVEQALTIAKQKLSEIKKQIFDLHKIKLDVSDTFLQSILTEGYNRQYGVRNLDRVLRQQIEDTVAKIFLEGRAKAGDTINL